MSALPKKQADKVVTLKGQEAEDAVLNYLRNINRPYGAADVSANIKNAVSKQNTQKILITLAERGVISQKTYGKTTYFVANQDDCEEVSIIQLDALEAEAGIITDENKELTSEQKALLTDLHRIQATSTSLQLVADITKMEKDVEELETLLIPLREGSSLVSDEEIVQLDKDWNRWRSEWVARKKIFNEAWSVIKESLPPSDALELADDLGIEFDSPEHLALEKGPFCQTKGKRK